MGSPRQDFSWLTNWFTPNDEPEEPVLPDESVQEDDSISDDDLISDIETIINDGNEDDLVLDDDLNDEQHYQHIFEY